MQNDHMQSFSNIRHRRFLQAMHFRHAHDSAIQFMADGRIEGWCETPDEIICCPAVEMHAPQDGSNAGKWWCFNITCGGFRKLSAEQFASIGGFWHV